MDEAACVDRQQRRRVVELRLLLDDPAHQVAQGQRVASGQRSDRREADVAALLATVPAGHRLMSRFGTPAWTSSAGCSSGRPRVVLGSADLDAGDAFERALDLLEAVVDDALVAVQREAHDPAPQVELARHLVDQVVGYRPLAVVPAARLVIIAAMSSVLMICGTPSIVRSSISSRNVSMSGPRSSSRQT